MPSPSTSASASASRARIRVATYNVYLGADLTVVFGADSPESLQQRARLVLEQLTATHFPDRATAIARLLVRERVDLVGLQEVSTWSRLGADGRTEVWQDFLTELTGALERAGEPYDAHAVDATFAGGAATGPGEQMAVQGANVVLVRRTGGVTVTGERTGDFDARLVIPTGMPDLTLEVARGWGAVDVEVAGRPLRFVNTHTEAWDQPVRDAQRDELLAAIGDPGIPVVVVGDFNARPDVVGMPEEYADAFGLAGKGDGFTCGQGADLAHDDNRLAERID